VHVDAVRAAVNLRHPRPNQFEQFGLQPAVSDLGFEPRQRSDAIWRGSTIVNFRLHCASHEIVVSLSGSKPGARLTHSPAL
jgi:hypothetical protein